MIIKKTPMLWRTNFFPNVMISMSYQKKNKILVRKDITVAWGAINLAINLINVGFVMFLNRSIWNRPIAPCNQHFQCTLIFASKIIKRLSSCKYQVFALLYLPEKMHKIWLKSFENICWRIIELIGKFII